MVSDYNPGDVLRVTYETTVASNGSWIGMSYEKEREVEVVHRAPTWERDQPIGTVRRFKDNSAYPGKVIVKVASRDRGTESWVYLDEVGYSYDTTLNGFLNRTDPAWIGDVTEVIGHVPGFSKTALRRYADKDTRRALAASEDAWYWYEVVPDKFVWAMSREGAEAMQRSGAIGAGLATIIGDGYGILELTPETE